MDRALVTSRPSSLTSRPRCRCPVVQTVRVPTADRPRALRVGGLTRVALIDRLRAAGVSLNASAETLLQHVVFDAPEVMDVEIVESTVGDLGFTDGATLFQIFAAAKERGLRLCPPFTGPYLRLSLPNQETAPDSVMSNGRAPSGSITVASEALWQDDEYPKGFYVRVVDGVPWLRGYCCSDQHVWSAEDRLAFRR